MINELNLLILFGTTLLIVAVVANMRFKVQRRLTVYERVLKDADNNHPHIMPATPGEASLRHSSPSDSVDIHAAISPQKIEQ